MALKEKAIAHRRARHPGRALPAARHTAGLPQPALTTGIRHALCRTRSAVTSATMLPPGRVRHNRGLDIRHLGGLHLTGVVQVGGPPRALRWRALQARRMSARRWRGRRDLSWPLAGDDVVVAHRVVAGGELEHPVENEPAASRAAAVEAEH